MKTRYLVYILLIVAGLTSGCISTYTYTEKVAGTSLVRQVEVKKNKTGQGERITEIHVLSDTLSGIPSSKEFKQFETEGERTRQLRHQKWRWENGKWIEETGAAPLKNF